MPQETEREAETGRSVCSQMQFEQVWGGTVLIRCAKEVERDVEEKEELWAIVVSPHASPSRGSTSD